MHLFIKKWMFRKETPQGSAISKQALSLGPRDFTPLLAST